MSDESQDDAEAGRGQEAPIFLVGNLPYLQKSLDPILGAGIIPTVLYFILFFIFIFIFILFFFFFFFSLSCIYC